GSFLADLHHIVADRGLGRVQLEALTITSDTMAVLNWLGASMNCRFDSLCLPLSLSVETHLEIKRL
ncbi:hypothetical protein M8C21_005555, partial [Ambrosia artemisiifolia]